MMFKSHLRGSILLLLGFLGFASAGYAQNGVSVRVSADFIERELGPVLKEELGSAFKSVSVSRKSDSVSKIVAKIDGPAIVDVKATIEVGFSCWWRSPDIRVVYKNHKIQSSLIGIPVPDFITHLFTKDYVDRDIVSSYLRALQTRLPNVVTDCPQFKVESNGDISMNWLQGSQCSNGATKHASCGYNQWGDGTDQICVNGYWEIDHRDCESCADDFHPSCPRRPGHGGFQQ